MKNYLLVCIDREYKQHTGHFTRSPKLSLVIGLNAHPYFYGLCFANIHVYIHDNYNDADQPTHSHILM